MTIFIILFLMAILPIPVFSEGKTYCDYMVDYKKAKANADAQFEREIEVCREKGLTFSDERIQQKAELDRKYEERMQKQECELKTADQEISD